MEASHSSVTSHPTTACVCPLRARPLRVLTACPSEIAAHCVSRPLRISAHCVSARLTSLEFTFHASAHRRIPDVHPSEARLTRSRVFQLTTGVCPGIGVGRYTPVVSGEFLLSKYGATNEGEACAAATET